MMSADTGGLLSVVQLSLIDFCDDVKLKLGNVRITQIPVKFNIATAGHKVQGMYGFPNWVYVVLSRVHTISGLFCVNPST